MSETKEFSLEQARVNDDTAPTSGVHSGSARASQKLDVRTNSWRSFVYLVVAHPLTVPTRDTYR